MPRHTNTTVVGAPFDAATIRAVWNRGTSVFGLDPRLWRRDVFGYLIRFEDFANEESDYGWHVDHIKPVSMGGFDGLQNLQPLYWRTNYEKSNSYPFTAGERVHQEAMYS